MRAPVGVELVAITGIPGAAAAKLRIVVAPGVELPAVAARRAAQARKHGVDAALGHGVGGGAVDLLQQGFGTGHHGADGGLHIVLPGPLVLLGLKQAWDVERTGRHQRIAAVGALVVVQAGGPVRGDAAFHTGTQHGGACVTLRVHTWAVVKMVGAVGIHRTGAEFPVAVELPIHRGVECLLLEGIAVRVVVAERHGRVGGRETLVVGVRHTECVTHIVLATTQSGTQFAVAVAAQGDGGKRGKPLGATAREDLHHTPCGVGAIQSGRRAFEHFDALDHVDRDVVPHRCAGRGRAVTHTVDQQDGVARFGAANENTRRFATSTVGRHLHRRGTRQHFRQCAASGAFDGFAVHHHHFAGELVGAGGDTGGGDHGFRQGSNLCGGQHGQCRQHSQGEHGQACTVQSVFHEGETSAKCPHQRPRQCMGFTAVRSRARGRTTTLLAGIRAGGATSTTFPAAHPCSQWF